MKANELMVGDFIRTIYAQKIIKVREIKQSCIYTNDNGYEYNEIEPIHLTTEILEKNGFEYDENRKAYLMGVIFRVKPERYGLFSFEICGCPYPLNTVHQLQHALRLCGIDKTIEL